MEEHQHHWYNDRLFTHVLLVVFFPVGLYALWKSSVLTKWWKITATALVALVVGIAMGPYDSADYVAPTYDPALDEGLGLVRHQLVHNQCELNYWTKDNQAEKWIVFLHGAGGDHRTFYDQVAAVASSYNLLLIDGRGQGKSRMTNVDYPLQFSDMIGDVIQILDSEHIGKTTIIAQSLGASLAQEVAYYHPERVDKMILIGCYNQHEETGSLWKVRNYLMTTMLRVVPWKKVVNQFSEMSSVEEEVKNYVIEGLINCGRDTWKNLGATAYATKHQVDKYEIPHSTLLIRGESDYPEMLAGIYARMQEVNPMASEVVIPNSGHICNMENVSAVNQSIKNFLRN